MQRRLTQVFRQAVRDDSGAVAVMFALLVVPMLWLSLVATDYGLAMRFQSQLQRAAESTASTVVHKLGQPFADIEAAARAHLDGQLAADYKGIPFSLVIAPENAAVEIRLASRYMTSFGGLVGVKSFPVSVVGHAQPERRVSIAKSIGTDLPRGLDRDVARALEEAEKKTTVTPSAEEQARIQRLTDELNRKMQDVMSRLGR